MNKQTNKQTNKKANIYVFTDGEEHVGLAVSLFVEGWARSQFAAPLEAFPSVREKARFPFLGGRCGVQLPHAALCHVLHGLMPF